MHRTFRRVALISCCGLGLAVFAPAAHAARSVTTLPANFVTTTSATLHGTIDTAGQTTTYRFQYGTSSAYGDATASQTITGQQQTLLVATIFQLKPNTTYHFRVSAIFFAIYPEEGDGQDLTFTTKPTGRLGLRNATLHVGGGFVRVPLRCISKLACRASFSISAHAPAGKNGPRPAVGCATRHFTIRPGKSQTVVAQVGATCRSLLRRNSNHMLSAHFTAQTQTGQRGVNRAVKLVG
jgi:hypothetical protein